MRAFPAMLAALLFVFSGPIAWSQTADPFAQGADPFAPGTAQQKAGQSTTIRAAVIQQAKKVLAEGKKPRPIAAASHSQTELRINATLSDSTSIRFIETPLNEAIETLAQTHNIPIIIDNRALEEIGLDHRAGVTISLKDVTLRSALRLMLRDLELTYLIKDEVLQITTLEAAESNLILGMYVLPENLAEKADQVIKVLTATVVPDTWDTLGGPSTALAIDHVLVISTTSDVHDRSEEFLAMLIEKYGK